MTAFLNSTSLRDKAEKQLSSRRFPLIQPDETDQLKLIHELQVHQVELQMQAEELRETLADADTLRRKYQDLFNFAPVGYLTLSRRGTIFEANKCAGKLLDQAPIGLVGKKLREIVKEESVASLDGFIAAAGESEDDVFAREIALLSSRPFPRFVNMQAHSIADETGGARKIRLAMMDVSALKTATDDIVQAMGRASALGDLH
jgi:PAS domain S-box-containing protein